MEEIIKFRPHHFMCTLGFRGKGYSTHFVRNYKKIVQTIHGDENTLIEVVQHMDDVCSACPNKIDDIICKTQSKITKLDAAHSSALYLVPGEVMSCKQAKDRIKKHMSVEKFLLSCKGCSWQKYGVCQESLEQLLYPE
jgi:hypothetical protein